MKADVAELTAMTDTRPVKRRRPGQVIVMAVSLVLAGFALATLIVNPNFDWPTVGAYLFDVGIWHGIGVTLELTLYAMIIGIALGVVLAILRQSDNPVARGSAALYIWFFRGTPVLVQVLFWGFAAAMLGLSRMATLRYVVLPQAMRVIIPPVGNQFISMLTIVQSRLERRSGRGLDPLRSMP